MSWLLSAATTAPDIGPSNKTKPAVRPLTLVVGGLTALVHAAREAYDAHLVAINAARAATDDFYEKVAVMHGDPGAGSDMIATIRNFARSTDDPEVYSLAQIPPPAAPSAAPPRVYPPTSASICWPMAPSP